jgi:hypothetical protein
MFTGSIPVARSKIQRAKPKVEYRDPEQNGADSSRHKANGRIDAIIASKT